MKPAVIFASAFPGYDNLVDEVTRFFSQRTGRSSYEFDRRFLFRILAMGHAQFAELLGIRGPNTQVNAACASTTMAVGMAETGSESGVAAACSSSAPTTSPRTTCWNGWEPASWPPARPPPRMCWRRRRCLLIAAQRMLLGMGGVRPSVESEDSLRERGMRGLCEVLGSEFANSASTGHAWTWITSRV